MTIEFEQCLPAILIINGKELNVNITNIIEKEETCSTTSPFLDENKNVVVGRRAIDSTFIIECARQEIENLCL